MERAFRPKGLILKKELKHTKYNPDKRKLLGAEGLLVISFYSGAYMPHAMKYLITKHLFKNIHLYTKQCEIQSLSVTTIRIR